MCTLIFNTQSAVNSLESNTELQLLSGEVNGYFKVKCEKGSGWVKSSAVCFARAESATASLVDASITECPECVPTQVNVEGVWECGMV